MLLLYQCEKLVNVVCRVLVKYTFKLYLHLKCYVIIIASGSVYRAGRNRIVTSRQTGHAYTINTVKTCK